MTKSTVPRGATSKDICPKCGRHYYNFIEKGKTTSRNICTICSPSMEDKK